VTSHDRPVTTALLGAILACVFSTWLLNFGVSNSLASAAWGFFMGSSLVVFISPELEAFGAATYNWIQQRNETQ